MKKILCLLLVFVLLFGSAGVTYANALKVNESEVQVILPQGRKLDDKELSNVKGEVAPWLVGGAIGGVTNAALKAVDNYLEGKRGADILDGCGKEFVKGAVAGALTAPVKTVTTTVGVLKKAKKVYDYSQAAKSVISGVTSYAVGEAYDNLTNDDNNEK